jgi:IS5 family transposase
MKRMARFQQTPASQASFAKYGRKSKRELFLDQMNQVVPWSELLALVEPFYPKAGNGRQPVGLAIMLRTYPPRRTAVVQPVGPGHGRSLL